MDSKKRNAWKTNLPVALCAILLIAIAGFFIAFATSEKVTTTGGYPEDYKNASLRCIANNQDYPFFRYGKSNSKTTSVSIIFANDGLDSISIVHELHYGDQREVEGSEAQNHAAMGIRFADDGLGTDPFSAHYSKQDGIMSMTLYAKVSELTSIAKKYFLIQDDFNINSSISDYVKMYKMQNFTCTKE